MPTDVERQFEYQVMAVYENGKRVLGYNATRFLQKIRADGGLAAAKSWLRPKKNDKPTKGFLMLVDCGRLDLSLEALVLNDPWNTLFNEDELAMARKRLAKYGYFEPKTNDRDRADLFPQQVDGDSFHEGSVHSVLINQYERNAAARAACIEHYGARCYVCDFNFAETYGPDFHGFIHVHHLCPLSSIGADYTIDAIADLRPVCPNCHAVIHKKEPCYTIEEVRKMLGGMNAK
jgi:hypothetical protein